MMQATVAKGYIYTKVFKPAIKVHQVKLQGFKGKLQVDLQFLRSSTLLKFYITDSFFFFFFAHQVHTSCEKF